MLLMVPLSYNLRSLTVRKVTTFATALGIALAVYVLASALMLSHGIERMMGDTGRADNAIVLSRGAGAELSSTIENDKVGLVLAKGEVAKDAQGQPLGVAELVVVLTMDKLGTDGISNVSVRGVDSRALAFRDEVEIIDGRAPKPGTDEVMVGTKIRGRFKGLELGQSFELRKNRASTVVGVFEAGGSVFESEVWADVDAMRAVFGRHGVASSMRVRLADPGRFDAFKLAVEEDKSLGLEVKREDTYYAEQSEGMSGFIKALGIMIAVFFSMGAVIGAMITMHASIANRRREIGTLRALGFSRPGILASFVFESVVLALVGGGIGVACAMAMGAVSFSMVNFATWSEVIFRFEPTGSVISTAFIFAAVIGVLGGFWPAMRAAFTSPVEAMRG
jgi:putative ABC transport system permease protein